MTQAITLASQPVARRLIVLPSAQAFGESFVRAVKHTDLVVVAAGEARCLVGGKAVQVSAGDVFLVTPESSVDGLDEAHISVIRLRFDMQHFLTLTSGLAAIPGYLALFRFEPRLRSRHGLGARLRLTADQLPRIVEMISRIESELQGREPGYRALTENMLSTLVVELARQYAKQASPLCEALIRISPSLVWLDEHFDRPVALEEIVSVSEMSQSTTQRCFRRCFGVSPLSYLLDLRMTKAQQLLRDTEAKVKEIAPSVGILDANYFTRRFRQHAGVEPTEYRARFRRSSGHSAAQCA